jgi:tetratricopeptide (TPR) repeat protein
VPKSKLFKKVRKPEAGTIAWWKNYMGITDGRGRIETPDGNLSLKKLEARNGPVTWYQILETEKPSAEAPELNAEQTAPLVTLAQVLDKIEAASSFTPYEETDPVFLQLKKTWSEGEKKLEILRQKFPDSPRVLAGIGEFYRRGHNLDVSGAWEKSEAYLLRAETLEPTLNSAYLSLGAHYGSTGMKYFDRAEKQFQIVIDRAKGEELLQAYHGLAMVQLMGSRRSEAAETLSQILKLDPENEQAKHLKDIMKENPNPKTFTMDR